MVPPHLSLSWYDSLDLDIQRCPDFQNKALLVESPKQN